LLGSLLATLVPLASAHAAPGPQGSLAPLATPQLCFSQTPASGCTSAPGLESARAVTVSADGHNLYVGGGTTISVFTRAPKTGALTQLAGPLGCLSSSSGTGCGHALGLSGVAQIALSPDGRHLYAVSSIAGSVTAFARDLATGALTQLRGAAGCVRPGGGGGCASGIGLAGATALAIAPDGRSLYVASHDANAVASFSIDPVRGALLQLGGESVLAFTMHHVVSDAWSVALFVEEAQRFYVDAVAGRPAGAAELPVQLADFATSSDRLQDSSCPAA